MKVRIVQGAIAVVNSNHTYGVLLTVGKVELIVENIGEMRKRGASSPSFSFTLQAVVPAR